MKKYLLGMLFALAATSSCAWAQQDPGASICLAVLKENLYDSQDVYSAQYHFSQYQSILKSANFSNYSDYSNQGAGLGLNIPLADALIGFSGDYKTDSGTFQQQMSTFLSSQFNESVDESIFSQQTETIDKQLVQVADNCQKNFYDTLKDRIKLSIRVEPDDYSKFGVKVVGYIPPPFDVNTHLEITQIEPTPDVQCTASGQAIHLPIVSDGSDIVLLTCTKDPNKNVQFAMATNLGLSDPLALPATPPTRPAQNNTPKAIKVSWTEDHPAANIVPFLACSCASVTNDLTGKTARVVNNCSQTVPLIYVKDTAPNGPLTMLLLRRTGRSFAYAVLGRDESATFDMRDAVGGMAIFLACPDVPTPTAGLVCRPDGPGAAQAWVPYFPPGAQPTPPYAAAWPAFYGFCITGQPGGKVGDSCSCPKAPPQSGTVSGHLDQ
jgi:hypothetical protein